MIQVFPIPRQLPRRVIWSIYIVTWLGLIVTIVIVYLLYDDNKKQTPKPESKEPIRESQLQHDNDTIEDVLPRQLLPSQQKYTPNKSNNNPSSMTNKQRRQQYHHHQKKTRAKARPGFVTLEEIVAYECNFQSIYQNTTWLEDSDTMIRYLDEFGQLRLMNILLAEKEDSLETSEQRVVDLKKVPWVGNDEDVDVTGMLLSDRQEITLGCVGVICNYYFYEVEGCWIYFWVLSSAMNEVESSYELAFHFSLLAQDALYAHIETPPPTRMWRYWIRVDKRKSETPNSTPQKQLDEKLTKPSNSTGSASQCGISALRSLKPGPTSSLPSSLIVGDGTLTCNTTDITLHTSQIHISKADELSPTSTSSLRWRRDVDDETEWKEPSYHNDKVYITKMLLEIDDTPMYFVAAPINNVSLRFVYSNGVPLRCLTCPEGKDDDTRLECLSSDAQLSRNARYYILYCRGPEVPWTAVISLERNEFVYRLDNQKRQREWYASRPRPVTHELEVKLDKQYTARVRLHLPSTDYWKDRLKRDNEKCKERLRLILRIADEQKNQMVNAEFDFSLTNYLVTVKGYAVVYADVRASLFQSFDFRHLRFRRRELIQMSDYTKVVTHILMNFECIEDKIAGVFGENYGGHMALNLVADNYEKRNIREDGNFRCGVAVNPLARWQDYAYPFSAQHTTGVTGALRKKIFERRYMRQLVSRLRNKNFAVHTSNPTSLQQLYYTKNLLKMLDRQMVEFEHQHYNDESVKMCDSRLKSYEHASDFFDRCFGREIDETD